MHLQVEALDVAYGRTQILFGVDLEVPDGSLTCLMGRNGMGKTTLLNALAGVLRVQAGRVLLDGEDVTAMAAHTRTRRGLGYVPQGHQSFPYMTVAENLQVVSESSPRADASAVSDAMDLFPVLRRFSTRQAGLLSGGQAQQLAIARALVTRPSLLMLDEPTEGIQPSIIHEIEDTIVSLHRDTDISLLLVEQYVELALRVAERYAVIEEGRITASGDTADADAEALAGLVSV